jgi:hypothetical protein
MAIFSLSQKWPLNTGLTVYTTKSNILLIIYTPFFLISLQDIVRINEQTQILKIIRQCDAKHIMG